MGVLAWLAALVGFGLAIAGVVVAVAKRKSPWLGTKLGYFVGAIALTALFGSVALGALDGLLARMHVVGAANRPLISITGIGTGASASFISETIKRWATWYGLARTAYVASPTVVLWAYLVVDSLAFVPAYITLLAMIRWRSATLEPIWKNESVQEESRPWKDIGRLLRRVGIPIALAAADLVENVLTEVFIREPLQRRIDPNPSDSAITVSGGAGFALRVATTLKWALAALLILNTIPALVVGLQAARRRFAAEHKRGRGAMLAALFRLRAMIFLVLGFCLIATLKLQVPDVIHRWSWRDATFAGISAVTFGVVVWLWSGRILPANREVRRRPSRAHLIGATIVVALGGVACLKWGPIGLFVPAGALLVLVLIDPLGPEGGSGAF